MTRYKKKKYPDKMTKSEMLNSENKRLKWELKKTKNENSDFIKAILFVILLMILSYFFKSDGPAWRL